MGCEVLEARRGQEGGHQRRRDVAGSHQFSTTEVEQERIEEHIAEKDASTEDIIDCWRRHWR